MFEQMLLGEFWDAEIALIQLVYILVLSARESNLSLICVGELLHRRANERVG